MLFIYKQTILLIGKSEIFQFAENVLIEVSNDCNKNNTNDYKILM